ncbi:MAG: hypothetical protein HYZ53_12815 [Planctomycetes bacterium]|nr:hypothetical protein [Planctomycetota bacterium]
MGAPRLRASVLIAMTLALLPIARESAAQEPPAGGEAPARGPAAPEITLQLKDQVELKGVVQLLAKLLGLKIIFDPRLLEGRKVSIEAPESLPREAVRALLDEVLENQGFALEAKEHADWLHIVPIDQAKREVRIFKPVHSDASELLKATREALASETPAPAAAVQGGPGVPAPGGAGGGLAAVVGPLLGSQPAAGPSAAPPPPPQAGAQLSLDATTNSILVSTAYPRKMAEVLELLQRLDRKRKQVLVEMVVVSVDDAGQFDFAIDAFHNATKDGVTDRFLSQLFGLSTLTGGLGVAPQIGQGFSAVVLHPKDYSFVVRALQTTTKARVLAAPRLLVRDNSEGTLQSVREEPFVSINASTTVSTTSFAGFASAGPQIKIRPRVTEGNSVYLDYSITLSAFTAPAANAGVPPPRKTDTVTSFAVLPDGHTVVVGGLKFDDDRDEDRKIPLLGDLPLLGGLFRSTSRTQSASRLFVFIRPLIIRDEGFLDLKNVSVPDLKAAALPSDAPPGNPERVMR